jgi:hypothetical protein
MTPRTRHKALLVLPIGALLLSLAIVPPTAAHTGTEVGPFLLEIGWRTEPALVGQLNAVQVTIAVRDTGKTVLNLGPEDLKVVVSTAGVDSPALAFVPAFDAEEGKGPLGEYDAALVPTAPGDYTFHITGSIRGTDIDVTLASSDGAFDPVGGTSDLEFPVKLPSLTEVGTRLDRIDGRIAALQSADPGRGILDTAADTARKASDKADIALFVGAVVGGAGLLVAVIALVFAVRASRRGSGPA